MSDESDHNRSHAKQKPSRFWIIGTSGKPTISGTFATIAFLTTTIVYIVSIFEKIGSVAIRHFDPSVCAAYMTPVLALYFGRRHTESKNLSQNSQTPTTSNPASSTSISQQNTGGLIK